MEQCIDCARNAIIHVGRVDNNSESNVIGIHMSSLSHYSASRLLLPLF